MLIPKLKARNWARAVYNLLLSSSTSNHRSDNASEEHLVFEKNYIATLKVSGLYWGWLGLCGEKHFWNSCPPFWHWVNTASQYLNKNEIFIWKSRSRKDSEYRLYRVNKYFFFYVKIFYFPFFYYMMRKKRKKKYNKHWCDTKPKQNFRMLKKGLGSDNGFDFWCVHAVNVWLPTGSEVWDPQQALSERGSPCVVMENLQLLIPFFYLVDNADNPDGEERGKCLLLSEWETYCNRNISWVLKWMQFILRHGFRI